MMNSKKLNTALYRLLRENKAENKSYITHTSMEPRGSYSLSRDVFEEFYDIYNSDKYSSVLEKPDHYSMLRFDFDIKVPKNKYNEDSLYNVDYTDCNDVLLFTKRFYSNEHLLFVIKKIQERINIVFNNVNSICCLFEKDIYEKNDKEMSGGFHLQFPYIFTEKHIVINYIINPIKEQVKNETGLEFDIGVYNNNWFLYGASKSQNHEPYILTRIFDIGLKEMTVLETFKNYKLYDSKEELIPIKEDNIEKLLPRIFSINSFNRECQEPNSGLDIIKPIEKEKRKKKINDNRDIEEKLAECRKLLPLLGEHRVDERNDWMRLGWCLYNIGEGCEEALDLWDEKSQESSKYEAGCCEEEWEKMTVKEDGLTMGSLKDWAKADNPVEYSLLYKKKDFYLEEEILYDCTHNNLAKIYAEYCQGEVFFTEGYNWIIFNQKTKIWTWNNNKSSLVYPISSFFSKMMKEYRKELFGKSITTTKDEEKILQNKCKQLHNVIQTVGSSSFCENIIKQLQSLLTKDNDFVDIFDAQPNLFAFSDGKLIDLNNKGKVRDIMKEDYIMTTTGYPYPERNETFIKKMNDIINSLSNDPHQIKSIKSLLSLPLWGINKNEIFAQLTGTGGNGKGLLDTGCRKVYGKYYNAIDSKELTDYQKDKNGANSSLASCRFARMVMAVEPEDQDYGIKTLKTPTIKKWTGQDIIQARFLYGNNINFTPKFVLMMQLNDLLNLSTNDDAIQRRMKVIELPFKFVKNEGQELKEDEKYRDENLKTLIATPEYRDAFFYILLDTWLETNGIFYESEKVKSKTTEYFGSQNPLREWFENYEESTDPKVFMLAIDALKLYKEETGNTFMTATKFGIFLKKLCKSEKGKKGIKYYFTKKRLLKQQDKDEDDE